MSSKGFVVFDYKILQKEITVLLFSILKLPIAGAVRCLDPLCKDNDISEASPVLQTTWVFLFLWSHWDFLEFSIQHKHSPYLTLSIKRSFCFSLCSLRRAPWPTVLTFFFQNISYQSPATEEQQERVVKGVWAQKANDLVYALSRDLVNTSCSLHVKKGMVPLRVGDPNWGYSLRFSSTAAAMHTMIAHWLHLYLSATFCGNLVQELVASLLGSCALSLSAAQFTYIHNKRRVKVTPFCTLYIYAGCWGLD